MVIVVLRHFPEQVISFMSGEIGVLRMLSNRGKCKARLHILHGWRPAFFGQMAKAGRRQSELPANDAFRAFWVACRQTASGRRLWSCLANAPYDGSQERCIFATVVAKRADRRAVSRLGRSSIENQRFLRAMKRRVTVGG
jgi:hypothetical protein